MARLHGNHQIKRLELYLFAFSIKMADFRHSFMGPFQNIFMRVVVTSLTKCPASHCRHLTPDCHNFNVTHSLSHISILALTRTTVSQKQERKKFLGRNNNFLVYLSLKFERICHITISYDKCNKIFSTIDKIFSDRDVAMSSCCVKALWLCSVPD